MKITVWIDVMLEIVNKYKLYINEFDSIFKVKRLSQNALFRETLFKHERVSSYVRLLIMSQGVSNKMENGP